MHSLTLLVHLGTAPIQLILFVIYSEADHDASTRYFNIALVYVLHFSSECASCAWANGRGYLRWRGRGRRNL